MKIIDLEIDETGELGVFAISFVEKPAIESEWVHLNKQEIKLQAINEERRMVYGAALIPNKPILRIDELGQEYYIRFKPDVIRSVAHRFFMQNMNHNATFEHEEDVQGVTFVESWVKEGESDKSVHLGLDVPVGTWLTGGHVENEELWQKVKAGEVKGFSIEGLFSESIAAELTLKSMLDELEEVLDKLIGQ